MGGFLLESLESLLTLGYVQNRQGLLYGPFTPVYGAGALALAFCAPYLKNRTWPATFLVAAAVCSVVEFLWSWVQETFFSAVFWDYTSFFFQIDGRVNLLFSLGWGVLGLFFLSYVYPLFLRGMDALRDRGKQLITWCLLLFMAWNITLSVAALSRHAQRQAQVPASSAVELFLDETYPDGRLYEQFPTMRLAEPG